MSETGFTVFMTPTTDSEIKKVQKQTTEQVSQIVSPLISLGVPYIDLFKKGGSLDEMKDSLNKGDDVKFLASSLNFTSVVILDTIGVLTYGSGKMATMPVKEYLKEVLENPTIRKNLYSVIKNNIDELSKYYPELATFKKSKLYKKMDTVLDEMFDTVKEGFEKFPSAKKYVTETLEKSKKVIPYKSESNVYSILNKQLEIPEMIKSTFRSMHGKPISILTVDKGSLGAINALDKSQIMGDTALTLYNTCVLKTSTDAIHKFKSGGLSIESIRTGSDEIIVVITGTNEQLVRDATTFFEEQLKKNLEYSTSQMIEPLQKAFSKVDIIPEHGYIYAKGNTFGITKRGKSQGDIIYSLSDFSARSEVRKTFKEYTIKFANNKPNHGDLVYLRELAGVKSKALDVIQEGTLINGVVGYRLRGNTNTQRIFHNLTEINNKGISAVEQNLMGPSVFNQLGHKFVDSLNYEYSKTLIDTAKKYGLEVKVYQSAPMQLAYKFDNMADSNAINLVLKESEQAFSKSLRKKGFTELKTFYNNSTTYTPAVSGAVNSNINLTSRLARTIEYSDEVIYNVNNVLSKYNLGLYYNRILEDIPKGVRNIDDLAQQLLTRGKKPNEILDYIQEINNLY